MSEEIVEVIRVLRYVGPQDEVMKELSNRAVKGRHVFGLAKYKDQYIEEAILGDYPQLKVTKEKEISNE